MAAPKGAAKLPPFMAESFAWETTVEVTVVSAEEVVLGGSALRRRPLSSGAYAVVHTMSAAARTRMDDEDGDCNGYPYWGEAVRVKVPAWSSAIDVEICRKRGGGDGRVESVASARVPVADFSVGPAGHLHCLSYRLFDSGSRMTSRNGIVNIRVKRLDGCAPPPAIEGKAGKAVVDDDCGTSGSSDGSCCGVNVAEERKVPSAAAAAKAAPAPAGVVMGFPVGYSADGHASGKGTV